MWRAFDLKLRVEVALKALREDLYGDERRRELLRDQLRQAARTWDEHGRSDDLLWAGSAYREYAVWRERYPGGLSELEEAFARAMTSLATRRRRRRRFAVAAGFAVLLAVLAVVGTLWRRSELETRRAEEESARRQAAQLLALGRLQLADHPNAALACAIAALEMADNEPARRFAVEALWQGPPAFFLDGPNPWSVAWSPDGRWLAMGGSEGVDLLQRDGSEARRLTSALERTVDFSADGRRLVTRPDGAPSTLHVWALPEGRLERTLGHAEAFTPVLVGDRLLTFAFDKPSPEGQMSCLVRELPLDGTSERTLGVWETNGLTNWEIDPTASSVLSLQRGRLVQQPLDALSAAGRVIGTHGEDVGVWMRPWRDRAVTGDSTGEVRIWDVPSARLERTLKSPADATIIALGPTGRFLATAPSLANTPPPPFLFLFDLAGPRAAEPAPLLQTENAVLQMRFSPDGPWLATAHNGTVILWNLTGPLATVLRGGEQATGRVAFTPDGDLLGASVGVLRRWSLSPAGDAAPHALWTRPGALVQVLGVDPAGRFAVMTERFQGRVVVVPLDGSPASTFTLERPAGTTLWNGWASLAPDGSSLAVTASFPGNPTANGIRILDLESGDERTLDTHPEGAERCEEPGTENAGFAAPLWLPDGRLVSDGDAGLRLWDLDAGSSRLLRPCRRSHPSMGVLLLATPDSRTILRLEPAPRFEDTSSLSAFDLVTGQTREITSHGNRLCLLALDPSGTVLVTGDRDGTVRVGLLTGGEPHLLLGNTGGCYGVAVSPDGRWIAASAEDGTIRLWPMPDLSKPALHTLPHVELLAKLRSLTNLRAAPDPGSHTGWKAEVGPFPGWAEVPEWWP